MVFSNLRLLYVMIVFKFPLKSKSTCHTIFSNSLVISFIIRNDLFSENILSTKRECWAMILAKYSINEKEFGAMILAKYSINEKGMLSDDFGKIFYQRKGILSDDFGKIFYQRKGNAERWFCLPGCVSFFTMIIMPQIPVVYVVAPKCPLCKTCILLNI